MRKIIILMGVLSLLILSACELPESEFYCWEYTMPDNITCDNRRVAGFNGEYSFYNCEDSRTYYSPEYFKRERYLSNSSTC